MNANEAHIAAAAALANPAITPLHHERAAELNRLALGVGISQEESRALMAAKLAEWDADYEVVLADKRRLTREIDVIIHGEEGVAQQPALCDVLASVRDVVKERDWTRDQNARLKALVEEASPLVEAAGTAALEAKAHLDEMRQLVTLAREFFAYLDTVEESDSGCSFHPLTMSCCRAMWIDDLARILSGMRSLVVPEGERCNRVSALERQASAHQLGLQLLDRAKEVCAEGDWDEWSEEVMELAEKLGVGNVRRVAYDPAVHGEGIEAEAGDLIWWWGESEK